MNEDDNDNDCDYNVSDDDDHDDNVADDDRMVLTMMMIIRTITF